MVSPFYGRHEADPFGFSQPFLSLFNDTSSQLDQLSSDLDSHLNDAFGSSAQSGWQKLLTSSPKFDVKETEAAYILEGEIPGVAKKDINLSFSDDSTLVLKAQSELVREEGKKPENSSSQPTKQIEDKTEKSSGATGPENSASEMSGANPDATKLGNSDTAVTTTNQSTDVGQSASPKPTYHLTERAHSSFQRVFSFPSQIKHDEVKASLKNGVLSVTIPKLSPEPAKEEPKGRTVTIEDANENEDAQIVDADKAKL